MSGPLPRPFRLSCVVCFRCSAYIIVNFVRSVKHSFSHRLYMLLSTVGLCRRFLLESGVIFPFQGIFRGCLHLFFVQICKKTSLLCRTPAKKRCDLHNQSIRNMCRRHSSTGTRTMPWSTVYCAPVSRSVRRVPYAGTCRETSAQSAPVFITTAVTEPSPAL